MEHLEMHFHTNMTKHTPYDYFSYPEKIIMYRSIGFENYYEKFSKNNVLYLTIEDGKHTSHENPILYYYTSIQYDSEKYPIKKTITRMYEGIASFSEVSYE